MKSYNDLVLEYSEITYRELCNFNNKLINTVKERLKDVAIIKEAKVNEHDILIIEIRRKESLKEVVYIVENINKLNSDDVAGIINDMEYVYRRSNKVCNYRIVALGGYDHDEKIDPSTYQKFGVKLEDISYFKRLYEVEEVEVDLVGHNQYAYEKIVENLKEHDRTAAIQPTGSGKSYLAARCVLDYIDKGVVLLSSSREIIQQFKKSFKWMNRDNIKMMTYSKLMKLNEEKFNELIKSNASLYVLDEYHRCGAKRWGERVKEIIDTVSEGYNSIDKNMDLDGPKERTKFIGLTATPIRDLDKERDMTKELFDGNIANEMTLSEAIVRKILPMPKYVIVFHTLDVDVKKIDEKIEKSKRDVIEKSRLKRELNSIVRKWTESKDVANILKKYITTERKFIVFCEDTDHVNEIMEKSVGWFKAAFGEDTKVHTYKVLYRYNSSNKELKKFIDSKEEGFHLLFNIEKLTEGMHSPGISGVILVRKTASKIKLAQMQGRCLQTDSENQPLILDLVNNIGNLKGITFEEDILNTVKKENKNRDEHKLNAITTEEVEEDFIHYIHDEVQDVVEMFSRLESKIEISWEENYEKLKQYYLENNTCRIYHTHGDSYLYRWSIYQRRARKEGVLSEERIKKLDEIGYEWEYKKRKFDVMFDELEEYYKKHGHTRVKESENKSLYGFVIGKRAKYARGELPQHEIEKLNELNFIWNVNDEEWLQGYRKMVDFYNEYGHSNPTENNADSDLVEWKHRLRRMYKNKKLSAERKALMDKLNFQWNIMSERWEEMFLKLVEYKDKYGNVDVKSGDKDYRSLALWLNDMKKLKKKGLLSPERERRLSELGVVWDVQEAQWDLTFDKLIKYYEVYKSYKVDKKIDITLYRWIKKQIRDLKDGKLSERRKKKLDEIGFFDEVM